jgi:hypothetical protein
MEHRGQKRLHELEEERQKLIEAQRLQLVALLGAEQVCSHNTIVCSHNTIIVCSHSTIVCSHGTGAARRRAGLQPRSAATRTRGGRRVYPPCVLALALLRLASTPLRPRASP